MPSANMAPTHLSSLAYISVQAPLTILEGILKKAASKRGISLPVWVSIPLASLTLQLPGLFLFWGPYFDSVIPLAPKPFIVA